MRASRKAVMPALEE